MNALQTRNSRPRRPLRQVLMAALLVSSIGVSGCGFLAGAALGILGVGAAYEYDKKREMDRLDREFERGKIDREEYLRRKKEIEDKSVVR